MGDRQSVFAQDIRNQRPEPKWEIIEIREAKGGGINDFTVEGKGDQWFYWRTARFGDKEERRGPYSSVASVTLMIARQLGKDIKKRDSVYQLPE